MIWLILGVALWWAAHLFKRAAPGARAALAESIGDKAKGIFAILILISVVLMVVGYRAADYVHVYSPPTWGIHLTNLLMLISVALFGLGSSKSRLRPMMRHPMLWGMVVWAVAHLLVRGHLAAIILWGGLALWAFVAMALINRREPDWTPWQGGTLKGDIRLGLITLAVYGVLAAIHALLGVWPFPR